MGGSLNGVHWEARVLQKLELDGTLVSSSRSTLLILHTRRLRTQNMEGHESSRVICDNPSPISPLHTGNFMFLRRVPPFPFHSNG
jgi:hypothetical protein